MNFLVERLSLEDVLLVRSRRFEDARGYFMESWSQPAFARVGIRANFVQDNQSLSIRTATVRGLHFQVPPYAQAKLVRVLKGAIFDVVVDLRSGSPDYGKWCAVTLTEGKPEQLYIPAGFAHGFMTLEPDTLVAYRVDAVYAPECDAGICWDDPDIGIEWPYDANDAVLSAKDSTLPRLAAFSSPFSWKGQVLAATA